MDVNDITEVADMKNRSEQRNDELQKALHTSTVEPHGDDDNMDGENFFGTQRLPTGAVGPPGPRLVTVRRGIDRRQQVGVEERSGSSAGQALIETREPHPEGSVLRFQLPESIATRGGRPIDMM